MSRQARQDEPEIMLMKWKPIKQKAENLKNATAKKLVLNFEPIAETNLRIKMVLHLLFGSATQRFALLAGGRA